MITLAGTRRWQQAALPPHPRWYPSSASIQPDMPTWSCPPAAQRVSDSWYDPFQLYDWVCYCLAALRQSHAAKPPTAPLDVTPKPSASYSDIGTLPAALCKALASLERSLRQHGSALVVRVGAWEEQLPQLAAELGAASILAEQEVEAGGWSCRGSAQCSIAL